MQWRHMSQRIYRSTFSWPWQKVEDIGQLHAQDTLPQRKNPWYRSYRRLCRPHNLPGQRGERNIPDFTGTQSLILLWSSPQTVTILTALSQLAKSLLIYSKYFLLKYKNTLFIILSWTLVCLNSQMKLVVNFSSDMYHMHLIYCN
jgi:hypothetical protein